MKKRLFALAFLITLSVIGLGFFYPGIYQPLESKWIDQYFKIRGPIPPQNNIVIATIDEKYITKIGRWPWPRSVTAKLIDRFREYEIKTAGFDITFSEPSPEDSILAESLKEAKNIFLGYFFYLTEEEFIEAFMSEEELKENEESIYPSRLSFSSQQMESSGKSVFGVQTNIPEISQALESNRQGFFNAIPDSDGVIRNLPLMLFYKNNPYPSLELQLASYILDFSPIPLFYEDGSVKGVVIGDMMIPLSVAGEFFINYRGPTKTYPHISVADILEGTVPKEELKDKIVLVGASAVGLSDLKTVPYQSVYPGVEIHANTLDNILTGDFIVTDADTDLISFVLIIGVGLLLGILLPFFRAVTSLFLFLTVTSAIGYGGYYYFSTKSLLIYIFSPILNASLVYVSITIYRYFTEERERRKVKKTFQHYLSPAVIKQVLENPRALQLGGERKELTVLFSDIRNFTSNSEKLAPENVVGLLNEYFTAMGEIIFKFEGTIDKYMGDAIMAIYGAPMGQEDHAKRASLTAIEMIDVVNQNKKEWCKKYGFDDFKIGIGINTGPMAVGNMGSDKRFNYTVIGDSVNLASRLEGLNKEYGTEIIASEAHYQQVQEEVDAKELGGVHVKGKRQETRIYQLTGKKK